MPFLKSEWLAKPAGITGLILLSLLTLPPVTRAQWVDPVLEAALQRSVIQNSSFNDQFEADVWLTDMSARLTQFIANPERRISILKRIHREATRSGLNPELVLALIQTESSFDRFAISRTGAQGLMQIMPFWKEVIGRPEDNLTMIDTNLRYGCTILSYYLKKENGDLSRALAGYNGSLGENWYPEKVLLNLEAYWQIH